MICKLIVCGLAALILHAAVAANPVPQSSPFLGSSAFPLPVAPTTDYFSFDNFELEASTLMAAAEPAGQLPCTSGNTDNKRQRVADKETMCTTKDGPPDEQQKPGKDIIPDFVPRFGNVIDGVPFIYDRYKAKKCVDLKYTLHLCCDGPRGPWIEMYQHWLEVEICVEREASLIHSMIFCTLLMMNWALAVVENIACERLYDECCRWVSHLSKKDCLIQKR